MKFDSRRFVIVFALVVMGALIALRSRRPDRESPPSPAKSAAATRSEETATRVVASAPATMASSAADRPSDAPMLAHVRARLHDYLTRQTDDDATADAITQELVASLTDENAPLLARGLSRAEIETPFGTAVLTRWLSTDPAAAATWLATHTDTTDEQNWQLGQTLETASAGFDTVDRILPDGALKQTMLKAAALARADTDPRRALALSQRMTPGPAQTSVLETIVYAWATSDFNGAAEWVRSVEDPALRERLLAVGAKALASSDPDLAATWLSATALPGAVANDTALLIAETWVAKNAPAAAAWVGGLKDPQVRARAMETVVKQWMATDAVAAGKWIATQPEGARVLAQLHAQEEAADAPKE